MIEVDFKFCELDQSLKADFQFSFTKFNVNYEMTLILKTKDINLLF